MITNFFNDVNSMGEKLLVLHAFRTKIVKLQKWVFGYIQCQKARVQLLWLALERIERDIRSEQISILARSENGAMHNLLNSKEFGGTVTRLDSVHGNLNSLLTQQQRWRRKQKQRDRIEDGRLALSSAPKSWHQKILHHIDGSRKLLMLRNLLGVQRRRHIVEKIETKKWSRNNKFEVDLKDVRDFLTTPGHLGVTTILGPQQNQKKRFEPFLLLHGGGLEELRYIAITLAKESLSTSTGLHSTYFNNT